MHVTGLRDRYEGPWIDPTVRHYLCLFDHYNESPLGRDAESVIRATLERIHRWTSFVKPLSPAWLPGPPLRLPPQAASGSGTNAPRIPTAEQRDPAWPTSPAKPTDQDLMNDLEYSERIILLAMRDFIRIFGETEPPDVLAYLESRDALGYCRLTWDQANSWLPVIATSVNRLTGLEETEIHRVAIAAHGTVGRLKVDRAELSPDVRASPSWEIPSHLKTESPALVIYYASTITQPHQWVFPYAQADTRPVFDPNPPSHGPTPVPANTPVFRAFQIAFQHPRTRDPLFLPPDPEESRLLAVAAHLIGGNPSVHMDPAYNRSLLEHFLNERAKQGLFVEAGLTDPNTR